MPLKIPRAEPNAARKAQAFQDLEVPASWAYGATADLGMASGTPGLAKALFPYFGDIDRINRENPNARVLSAEEANSIYGIEGTKLFDQPISEPEAKYRRDLKWKEAMRHQTISDAELNFNQKAVNLGVGLTVGMLDPINAAFMLIPGIGESAIGARITGALGKNLGRFAIGATEGAVGNLAAEPFIYAGNRELDYEYSLADSFINVAAGGLVGGGLHMGLGALHDHLQFRRERVTPEVHEAMGRSAVGLAMEGKMPDVSPVMRAHIEDVESRYAMQDTLRQRAPDLDTISRLANEDPTQARLLMEQYTDAERHRLGQVVDVLSEDERDLLRVSDMKDFDAAREDYTATTERLKKDAEDLRAEIDSTHQEDPTHAMILKRELDDLEAEIPRREQVAKEIFDQKKYIEPERGVGPDGKPVAPKDGEAPATAKYRERAIEHVRKSLMDDLQKMKTHAPFPYENIPEAARHARGPERDLLMDIASLEKANLEAQTVPDIIDENVAKGWLDEIMPDIKILEKEGLLSEAQIKRLEEAATLPQQAEKIGKAMREAVTCVLEGTI